jgi:type II secretory pathway component PulF
MNRLSSDETRDLAQHIAGLAQAGLPLPSGLRALSEELGPGALRGVVADVAARLERGDKLEDALEAVGNRLPGHLRDLILAGVRSGRIEAVLGEFVNYSQIGVSLRRKVWLSLAYPSLLIVAYFALFVFVCRFIARGFKGLFMDFGISIPVVTRSLFVISDAVTAAGWGLAVAPLVGVVLVYLATRFMLDSASRSRLASQVPMMGSLVRWSALAEFAHYLGLLLDCNIPLAAALPLAADGTRDGELTHECRAAAREVQGGASLADSISWRRIFPPGFGKMLRWAEGHQSLSETLHMMAEMFEARAGAQATFIGSVTGVLAVILVIWGCVYVVVSLFLPLIQLISKLSG